MRRRRNEGPDRDYESEAFWEDVQLEVRLVNARDFQAFLDAGDLPFEPRPEFERALLAQLKQRFLPDPSA